MHAKAKQLGMKLSMLIPMSKLQTPNRLNLYDRLVGLPATAPVEEWVAAAHMIHRSDPIDAIGGFNEVFQGYAATISRALQIPFHVPEVIRRIGKKDEMRRVLRENGLDPTPSLLVTSPDEIAAFGEDYGYPLVIKPVDGRGSLGVSIVRNSREIPAALDWFNTWSPGYGMLVEKFLEGEEYSVEAFSERGRHRVVCVTQKFKDPITSVETGHCLPAPITDDTHTLIAHFVTRALTVLGLENGPSHTEVILTGDGPRIVETHARLGGDSIVDLIQLVSGTDLDELWIRQTAGEQVFDEVPSRLDRFAAIYFVTPRGMGTLERVERVEDASSMAGVVRVEVLQDLGTKVQGAYDSFSRGACVIAVGDTSTEATVRAQKAAEHLRFVVS
ncbi:ATP-grasp domain-containing protein [Numidum massiliense]|uniref:ATP-grasp domain-containing protein n=1 Tax=Numidum massiliense TaxID=1522315 RepID=UPI0006D57B3B|nr:ATP-grasp domain-containing protein [Numidum massiliense]